MNHPSDADLWRRVRDDDADAFGQLFERHGERIHGFAWRRTANAAAAEDVTALAITTEGDWTTVRLADVEADARAVVDELVAAGIDARLVSDGEAPAPSVGAPAAGVGWLATSPDESDLGLEIVYPVTVTLHPVTGEDPFEAAGVRLPGEGDDWDFSIRSESGLIVLVWEY
jgi:hypothetical protein